MKNIQSNRISTEISEETLTKVLELVQQISQILPFLIGLTNEERMKLPKISRDNKLLIQDIEDSMKGAGLDIIPNFIDKKEMDKDFRLYEKLDVIAIALQQLLQKVQDTRLLAGSEAFSTSLMIYRMYQIAAESGIPGAKSTFDRMSQRFKGFHSTNGSEESTEEK